MNRPIVVAMTGASGAVYARRLLEVLLRSGRHVHLAISAAAAEVWEQELGWPLPLGAAFSTDFLRLDDGPSVESHLQYFESQDYFAPMASGSYLTAGMVVCPCSGDTLSAIAHGAAGNLIRRAAEVHLKERRKLVLVPRETPLSLPSIENMRLVTQAGAVVLPASPGWYHGVRGVKELGDFVVARILQQLEVPTRLIPAWGMESTMESPLE